jgi:hypothetical protein
MSLELLLGHFQMAMEVAFRNINGKDVKMQDLPEQLQIYQQVRTARIIRMYLVF